MSLLLMALSGRADHPGGDCSLIVFCLLALMTHFAANEVSRVFFAEQTFAALSRKESMVS